MAVSSSIALTTVRSCFHPWAFFHGLLLAVLLASHLCGCALLFEETDSSVEDASISIGDAVDETCTSFSQFFNTCELQGDGIVNQLHLDAVGTYRYNTDTLELTAPADSTGMIVGTKAILDGNPFSVIAVDRLEVGADAWLLVEGTLPLAIVVFGDAQVTGRILISSGNSDLLIGEVVGAGARSASNCGSEAGAVGGSKTGGGGGGGGGGFAGEGGAGGNGNFTGTVEDESQGGIGGLGRVTNPVVGGCPGGFGGIGSDGVSPSSGGAGGGAIVVVAEGWIELGGALNASGAGGAGGGPESGGGGGGSGGFVRFEAASIEITGVVVANGGGGGQGSGSANEPLGNPGGVELLDGVGGLGGKDSAFYGGNGENSGGGKLLKGMPGNLANGGGGGGGSGVIEFYSPEILVEGIVSPPFRQPGI